MPAGRILAVGAACLVGAAAPVLAQTRITGGGELGFARVDYDVLLPSIATFASADAAITSPATLIAARATLVQFESGRLSAQGVLAGSQFLPLRGPVRIELSGTAGASTYADTAHFAHGLGRLRIHAVTRARGGWVGAALGSTSLGAGWRPATHLGAGVWSQLGPGDLTATATATAVGDTAYTDIETSVRLALGRVTMRGTLGVRGWTRGTDRETYGAVSASVSLVTRVSVELAASRFPTDPFRGSIAGSQLSTGVRFAVGPRPASALPGPAAPTPGGVRTPGIEVHEAAAGKRTLRLRVRGATTVEVMGDFTDWQPIALTRSAEDWWEVTCDMPSGARRLNFRVDGGAWHVPPGAMRVVDGFGTDVGVILVP